MSVFINHYELSYIVLKMIWIFLREIIIWTFAI